MVKAIGTFSIAGHLVFAHGGVERRTHNYIVCRVVRGSGYYGYNW